MRRYDALALVLLASACPPAAARVNRREVRPELDVYFNEGQRVRLLVETGLNQGGDAAYSQGRFGFFADLALRPLFRRRLRNDPAVFRNRYLTFRAGSQYIASFPGPGRMTTASSLNLPLDIRFPAGSFSGTATEANFGLSNAKIIPPGAAAGCRWNAISSSSRSNFTPTMNFFGCAFVCVVDQSRRCRRAVSCCGQIDRGTVSAAAVQLRRIYAASRLLG
jgi:hypothetical protein